MNRKEILKFIQDNQGEKLLDFYNKTYEKLKDLNKRIDKVTLYLIVIVVVYFITSKAAVSSIQLGPIAITDISLIPKLLPILFSYLFLELAVTAGHKAEVFTTVKLIFLAMYKQDVLPKDLEYDKNNFFTRQIIPFSYSAELGKFNMHKASFGSCIGAILLLPLLSLIVLPFYFEYLILNDLYTNHFSGTVAKLSFYLSIWIVFIIVYYYVNTFIVAFRNQKAERN